MQLRDYQLELVNKARDKLINGCHSVLVQSPAGSGKSVTMAEIAKRTTDNKQRVLFIVHRRELVEQITNTFTVHGVDMNLCVVGMVQTIKNRLEKLQTPNLILIDECHHSLAKSYRTICDYFSNAYLLGFTATPWRLSGEGFTELYDDIVLGKSVKWLIDNHRLAPYKYYSKNFLSSIKLQHSHGEFSNSSINKAFESLGKTIYGDIVKEYQSKANGTKAIVYTHNVQTAYQVAKAFNESGYTAMAVDGTTDKQTRQLAMDKFRAGDVKILCNAELYGEGVDVPDCQTVMMLRPTESLSLYIQMSMRCMRYKENKQAIILDFVGNYLRHQLPDSNREWSLNAWKKKGQRKKDIETVSIRQCEECFAVIDGKLKQCPLCGAEIKIKENKLSVDVLATLEEITQKTVDLNYLALKQPKDLTTYKEFSDYAKLKGYKQGWVYYQCKIRNIPLRKY